MKTAIVFIGIIIIVLMVFGTYYNSPKMKGVRGEKKVKKELMKLDGKLINDFMVRDRMNNKSHQIDHIFISCNGIFVIETKNYAGRIYGDDHSQKWTQVLNFGKVKNRFYSPVKQNETHIKVLRDILGNNETYINLVVFVQNNTRYIKSNFTHNIRQLITAIKNHPAIYDQVKVLEIYNKLTSIQDKTTTNKEHVKEIKDTLRSIENNFCPRCGAPLVRRKSRNGEFYGCSNYPKCTFTKKIDTKK